MKRIRASRIINRVINQGETALFPVPFAGKYPTRISWQVVLAGGVRRWYEGKPSAISIQRMLKWANNPQMISINYTEVDKANVVCSIFAERRRFQEARASLFTNWTAYHPLTPCIKGWEWLQNPWWRRVLGTHPVYSPVEKLERQLHEVPYRSWFMATFGREK